MKVDKKPLIKINSLSYVNLFIYNFKVLFIYFLNLVIYVLIICSTIALIKGGGTAFPICIIFSLFVPVTI